MNKETGIAVAIAIIVVGGAAYVMGLQQRAMEPADTSDQVEAQILDPMTVGVWKSNEDAKFVREFRADGTVVDRYEGDDSATDVGTWSVVDPAAENTGAPAENLAGTTVLKLNFQKSGPLYFGVNGLSETSLELTNLGRGNMLTFTKVAE